MIIHNIVIGVPIASLEELDILPSEETVHFNFEKVKNDKGEIFLPSVLVQAGLFKSTSEIRRINKVRSESKKIKDPLSRNLWRTLTKPEFTYFKIGKKVFWLCVGIVGSNN